MDFGSSGRIVGSKVKIYECLRQKRPKAATSVGRVGYDAAGSRQPAGDPAVITYRP